MCLAGAVIASLSLTQEVAGGCGSILVSNTRGGRFTEVTNIYTEFSEFSENI